jgi:aminopeptidase N
MVIAPGVAAVAAALLIAPMGAQADTAQKGTPGAPGIGDQLYPTLGNGGYTVSHYDLALTYGAKTSDPMKGTVTLRAQATQELSRFDLDFGGKSVGPVTVDGHAAKSKRDGDELVITPSGTLHKGQAFTIVVKDFVAVPTVPDPKEFLSTVFVQAKEGTVWSGQPNGAHKIFPSNDHPSDKAGFSFRISAPSAKTVVANGVLTDKKADKASGRTVWRYEQKEPMATELAQVAVGDYTVIDRGRNHGVAVRDVVPTVLKSSLGPKLAAVNGQLDWIRSKVGDYPFKDYGSLVIQATLGFALETQTLSLYDTPWFDNYPQGVWDPVMLHELAHQWFGDSVAPAQWGDVWQNEGHASWYEYTYAESKGYLQDDAGAASVTELMKALYAVGDQWRQDDGPVGAPKSGDVYDLFNENVYGGGALVLYALRQKIGTPTFEKLERAWVSQYGGKSASTQDFIALASSISGKNLKPFLTDWLYGTKTPPMPGHPDWKVDPPTTAVGGGKALMAAHGLKPLIRH